MKQIFSEINDLINECKNQIKADKQRFVSAKTENFYIEFETLGGAAFKRYTNLIIKCNPDYLEFVKDKLDCLILEINR
jgi:hypothetical protein